MSQQELLGTDEQKIDVLRSAYAPNEHNRRIDWQARELAANSRELTDIARYELVTFGLEGPDEAEQERLHHYARSVGELVLLTEGAGMDFSQGYLGSVAGIEYAVTAQPYAFDHMGFEEPMGLKTSVDMHLHPLVAFSNTSNLCMGTNTYYTLAGEHIRKPGRLNLATRHAIMPYPKEVDASSGDIGHDFTKPLTYFDEIESFGTLHKRRDVKMEMRYGEAILRWFQKNVYDSSQLGQFLELIDKAAKTEQVEV